MGKIIKLKIVCLNLWLGGVLFDEILEFLKNENPDLILLQEVFNGDESLPKREHKSFSVLKDSLNYKYSSFAPAFLENISDSTNSSVANSKMANRQIEQGNAIFSKFPIEEQSVKFYDIPFGERIDEYDYYSYTPRNLQHVLVDLSSRTTSSDDQGLGTKKLHVFNTQGIWGKHGDDTERRLKMGEFIVNEVKEKTPLLLAGDFNLNTNTKTIKKIESVLESVFKDELKTGFNLPRKDLIKDPGYAISAVDMMFVSKDVKVTSHNCPDVDISDHLPLIAELEIS